MSIFSMRLKDLRKLRKHSQQEMTDKLNQHGCEIGRTAYQAYESGRVRPSIDVAYALSDILGTSIDYLCGKTEVDMDVVTKSGRTITIDATSADIKNYITNLIALLDEDGVKYNNKKIDNATKELLKNQLENIIVLTDKFQK